MTLVCRTCQVFATLFNVGKATRLRKDTMVNMSNSALPILIPTAALPKIGMAMMMRAMMMNLFHIAVYKG